ncbi:MAG TPA: glycerate kinase, partial [Ohtaekwangia sp.]|nr:glycerate kinase [Ohtaekwangia sp.]
MTILIAPDKFKGSLTAKQVCDAIQEALLEHDPTLNIMCVPLADGGEGTGALLTASSGGKQITVHAHDPLFRRITTAYGISQEGTVAFIEMASASGFQLLKDHERNPMLTSSYGTGELIRDALDRGVKKIILG